MLDDVSAIELDVFHERLAIWAVEDDMLFLAGRTAALDHYAQSVGWPHGSMDDVGRNKNVSPSRTR